MKKIVLFAIALCLFSTLKAQKTETVVKEQNPTIAVAILPQSFAYNAAEIDLDLRIAERQWLTIAPRFQFASNDGDYYYDAVDAIKSGFGLGFNYRYFPLTRRSKLFSDGVGPFISVGLRGQTTAYEYTANSYLDYTNLYDNGGLIPSVEVIKERVSQIGGEFNIGYSLRFFDILFVEGSLGVGDRFSNYDYNPLKGMNLGEDQGDTGFTGYCITGGIRLGIFLNRYTRK